MTNWLLCDEQPDFDFDLKFLGGDIGAVPGVEKMIDVSSRFSSLCFVIFAYFNHLISSNIAHVQSSIRTAVMDSLVWPSRIVVPMMPGDFRYCSVLWCSQVNIHCELFLTRNEMLAASWSFIQSANCT